MALQKITTEEKYTKVKQANNVHVNVKNRLTSKTVCFKHRCLLIANRKKLISETPLNEALNALILAIKDSVEALVER